MFFIHKPVTFGVHNPGGSCITKKTESLAIPGLYSKLKITVCHRLYSNVWLASVISDGWCLAVNPQPPPHLPLHTPWKCLSSSSSPIMSVLPEQMVNTSLMPCLSVCLSSDAAQSLAATQGLNISHWQRSFSKPPPQNCENYTVTALDGLSARIFKVHHLVIFSQCCIQYCVVVSCWQQWWKVHLCKCLLKYSFDMLLLK